MEAPTAAGALRDRPLRAKRLSQKFALLAALKVRRPIGSR
jgi:hypothetical protein